MKSLALVLAIVAGIAPVHAGERRHADDDHYAGDKQLLHLSTLGRTGRVITDRKAPAGAQACIVTAPDGRKIRGKCVRRPDWVD